MKHDIKFAHIAGRFPVIQDWVLTFMKHHGVAVGLKINYVAW